MRSTTSVWKGWDSHPKAIKTLTSIKTGLESLFIEDSLYQVGVHHRGVGADREGRETAFLNHLDFRYRFQPAARQIGDDLADSVAGSSRNLHSSLEYVILYDNSSPHDCIIAYAIRC